MIFKNGTKKISIRTIPLSNPSAAIRSQTIDISSLPLLTSSSKISQTMVPSVSLLYQNQNQNNSLLKRTIPQITNDLVEDELKMEVEEEEFATVDTFNDYMPSKCKAFHNLFNY